MDAMAKRSAVNQPTHARDVPRSCVGCFQLIHSAVVCSEIILWPESVVLPIDREKLETLLKPDDNHLPQVRKCKAERERERE